MDNCFLKYSMIFAFFLLKTKQKRQAATHFAETACLLRKELFFYFIRRARLPASRAASAACGSFILLRKIIAAMM